MGGLARARKASIKLVRISAGGRCSASIIQSICRQMSSIQPSSTAPLHSCKQVKGRHERLALVSPDRAVVRIAAYLSLSITETASQCCAYASRAKR